MRTAQHLSSIRQKNSGLSPEEREALGEGYCSFQTKNACCRLIKMEYLFERIRPGKRSHKGSSVNQKTAADTNSFHGCGEKTLKQIKKKNI